MHVWKRCRGLIAVLASFALFVGLALVAVTLSQGPSKPTVPVQQRGTAAGLPHRVPAAADVGRIVDGRFVSDSSAASKHPAGPVAENAGWTREVPGAVPPATKPRSLKLAVRGNAAEAAKTLAAPAPKQVAGYNPTTSRELAPSRADQVVYANADGTKTAVQYQNPVNYQLPGGRWSPASTSLVPSGSPAPAATASADASFVTPAAASPSMSVSPSPTPSRSGAGASVSPSVSPSASSSSPAEAPAGGWKEKSEAEPESFAASASAADLVTVPLDGSDSVSFGINGAVPVTGAASGSTVSYAGARPDSSVSFTAGTGLVKEDIVLSSPSAPDTWIFPLDLKGLRARMGPGGIIEFADSAGKVLAYVPHGFMTDSNIDPHSGNGAMSSGVAYSLVTVGGRQAIEMTLDAAWLNSKSRVYPVTVDPSVQDDNPGSSFYTFDGNINTGNELEAGTYDGGGDVAESYLDFSGVGSDLTNDTVLGVRLNLFNSWSYSCSPRAVGVYPITSSMSGPSVPSTGGEVGSKTFATGWVPEGSTTSPCRSKWEGFDLDQAATNLVNGWTHGRPDYGFAVNTSHSDSYAWKKFGSGANGTGDPSLAVTYTTDGASYKLGARHAITNVTPTSEGTFAIKVTNTGSKTWDASNGNGYEISSTAYYASGAGGRDGAAVSGSQVFTALPSTLAPGASATVDAKVAALSAGAYRIVFDMYSGKQSGGSPQSFASQGIQDFEIALNVPEPPPVVSAVYPPTGFVSTTLQQQLSTSATGDGTVTYDFTLTCKPLSGQTCVDSSVSSGFIAKPYWTPAKADLDWDMPYSWTVAVKSTSGSSSSTTTVGPVAIEAEPPQPAITSDLGSSGGQDYDPLSGNYTTSATDAAASAVGPPLEIDRTYNSMDPRLSGAFGAGWSSVIDTSLMDNGSTVSVTLPDGQRMTFGENGDGTYAAPFGSPDALMKNSSGTWTLRDASGNRYAFTSAGLISSITNAQGYAQDFTYNASDQVTAITDEISGRTLTLAWGSTGGTYDHVTSVTTPAPASGTSGYTWTYSYSGDQLAQVCAPAVTGSGCTAYTTDAFTGSHYWSSVLDANPRVYYQLGESSGTVAADEVDANLGTTDGTYSNVTLGAAGPLAGSGETAASFNGTSSYVSLPNNLMTDSTDVSVGLWFKAASGSSGVLFAYSAGTLASGSEGDHAVPGLYIGTNGELYGEIYAGSAASALHSSVAVNNGQWHYAVLSASSNSQALYLDGVSQGTLAGQVNPLDMVHDSVGAGFWGSGWPEAGTAGTIGHFDGDIAQVAVYAQPLSAADIVSQYSLAQTASPELTQVTLPSGKTYEQASYDPDTSRLTSYTSPDGGQWQIGDPLASGTKTSSDALGAVAESVTVTDPAGRQETYDYDMTDGGHLISYGNGVDSSVDYGYDSAGFLTTVVDSDGNLVCLTNDVHGNVLTRTWYPIEPATLPGGGTGVNPSDCGGSTSSSPDCAGSNAAPCTTFYGYTAYNAANPLDPSNDKLTSVRDGRSASATDDTYDTTYEYNTTGQLISETTPPTSGFPDGRTTRYSYSTGTETAANGGTIPAGLLESQTSPGGAVTSYSYDSNGDLAKVTEPSGRYTDYTYDGLGRAATSTVYTSTYPSGETTSYTYTPTGQQATVTDPAITNSVTGVTHQLEDSYTYDDDDNVATETQSDLTGGDPSRTTSYTYTPYDQVATVTQPAGATTGGTPQSAEEGASSANPGGATTAYDYDGFGNVTRVTDPNGNQYQYTYNEYQEPTSESLYTSSANEADSTATCTAPAVQDPDGGCDLVLKSDAYDPAGLLASETDAMGRITNYGYNSDQELDEVATSEACSASVPCASAGPCTPTDECTSGAVGVTTDYQYDGAGNMVTQTEVGTGADSNRQTITNYTYDAADQLDEEVQDATPPGDQGASGYANRTTAYTYDADGHALSKTVGSGTGTALAVTDYAYDTAGDMTSQSVADQGAGGPVAWFPLTQSSGTSVPDSVSGGQPAISDGAATWNGSSATFPGDWGDISTNGPVADTTGSFSVSAWVNLAGDTSSDQIAVSQSAGTQSGFVLKYLPATGSWEFSRPETDTTDSVNSNADDSTAASTGTWTLLTGTYDVNSGSMTLYVNGTAAGSATDSTPIASKGPLLIGAGQYDGVLGSFFDGSIADVQVYPYALSSSQVSTLYGKGQGGGDVTTGQLTTSWTYDQNGKPLSETSPDGNVTTYAYDPDGNLVMQTGPRVAVSAYASQTPVATQAVTTYGYDTFGDQTQVKDPDQNVTATAYDGDGRVTSVTQPSYTPPGSSTAITATTSYAYDEDGNLASETDPQGNATSYTYDALGDVTSVTDPELPGQSSPGTWTYTYDADGEQLSAKDPLGNTTSQTYDGLGNVATSTDALGSTTQYAYDYLGDQTVVDTPDGSVTTNAYNGLGDLTSSMDGAGNTTTYSYNDQGNLADELHPDGTNEEYGYDQAGHETSVTDYAAAPAGQAAPELRSESFGYDADGNQTSATDWDGNTTTSLYNPADELTSQVQPASSSSSMTTSYGYDAAGNRTSVTGGNGNTTWTTYNSWNLPESVVEPATSSAPGASDTTWTTAYNADGAPSSVTEPGGVSLSYGYDPLGDITSESGTGATAATPDRSFTYDTDQRMTSATSGAGTDSFAYNADGDLTGTSGPSGTSSYTYNNDGLVASETDAAGTTGYTYDSADRLSTETDPLTGSTMMWGYNSDSNPTSVSYATNGTAGPVQSYGYNALQQLTSDNLTSATGSLLASETYGYDNNGNVTSQATGGGLGTSSATYAYDEANRLVSSASGGTTTDYGYDGDGNLTQDGSATNVYNAQDQLTSSASSAGTTNYSYTLNGNLASATPGSGSATDYTWDAYGDLASAGGTGYGYDALGRLVSSTTGSGSTSMSYLGSGQTIASDGSSLYSYDPSGNETAAESVSGGPGSATAVMSDQHGDIVAAFGTSASTSSLAGYASYGPWGNVISSGGTMPGTGFQGDYTDPTTGLVHMGARWYNPADGSFVSSDTLNGTPIPSTADGNPYAYAGGNPLTGTDPSGHFRCEASCNPVSEVGIGVVAVGEAVAAGVSAIAGWLSSGSSPAPPANYLSPVQQLEQWAQEEFQRAQGVAQEYAWALGELGPVSTAVVDPAEAEGGPGSSWSYDGSSASASSSPGSQPCTITCTPPPPPPPPQDCFAGPDPTCAAPPTPGSLLHAQYITNPVKNITSTAKLCKLGLCLTETNKSKQGPVKGTAPNDQNANAANQDNADQETWTLLQPIKDQGVQPDPEPERQPAAGSAGAGKGSGNGCLGDQLKGKTGTLQEGDVGSFDYLSSKGSRGDDLTPHHIPQAALGWTPYGAGATVALTTANHRNTRTYGANGKSTKAADAGLSFQEVLDKDYNDLRGLNLSFDVEPVIGQIQNYYETYFPQLFNDGGC